MKQRNKTNKQKEHRAPQLKRARHETKGTKQGGKTNKRTRQEDNMGTRRNEKHGHKQNQRSIDKHITMINI